MVFFLRFASLDDGNQAKGQSKMLNIEEIRRRLQDRRPGIVGAATGLTPLTVARIRDGVIADPKLSEVEALSAYFEAQQ